MSFPRMEFSVALLEEMFTPSPLLWAMMLPRLNPPMRLFCDVPRNSTPCREEPGPSTVGAELSTPKKDLSTMLSFESSI